MAWYTYYGGYDYRIDHFRSGHYSDNVLYLPNVGNAARYGKTLYIYGIYGGTLTVNGDFSHGGEFKYSTNGVDICNAQIVDSWSVDNELYFDDVTNVYLGNGLTKISVDGSYNADIRLDDTSLGKWYVGIKDITSYSYGGNILWGNNLDNKIESNNGNSNLWGGWEGNDTLSGSDGADLFLYNRDGGHDIITNANSTDTVWFFNANPGDCNYYYDDANNIMHIYVGNGELEVNCSTGDEYVSKTYPVYQFADGTRLTYVDGNWRGISWDTAEDINADSPMSLFDDSGEFVYTYGDGRKDIISTNNENIIFLNGITLDQISSAEIINSGVNLKFNDGGSLNVYGQTGDFIVNGENYHADYQNKTWTAES
ncbi:MAG: hypothetical protein IJS81_06540 [Selenomonadaceae bacterium]|nr:hypothetical protein [Selenomonadaceae bacterium]